MKDLKITILLIVFALSFLFAIGLNFLYQDRQSFEGGIAAAIETANYCETAADCSNVGSVCPFGCDVFVNEAEAGEIKTLLAGYQSTCQYFCVEITGVACTENKCVTLR